MKRIKTKIVVGSLLMFAFKAFATEYNLNTHAGANALAGSASFANGGSVGNVNAGVTQNADYSDLRIVPPAIAPNASSNVICPMISPRSSAFSVFFLSMSGTTGQSVNGLCVAHHSGQKEMVHQIACDEDGAYKKAAKALGIECK